MTLLVHWRVLFSVFSLPSDQHNFHLRVRIKRFFSAVNQLAGLICAQVRRNKDKNSNNKYYRLSHDVVTLGCKSLRFDCVLLVFGQRVPEFRHYG